MDDAINLIDYLKQVTKLAPTIIHSLDPNQYAAPQRWGELTLKHDSTEKTPGTELLIQNDINHLLQFVGRSAGLLKDKQLCLIPKTAHQMYLDIHRYHRSLGFTTIADEQVFAIPITSPTGIEHSALINERLLQQLNNWLKQQTDHHKYLFRPFFASQDAFQLSKKLGLSFYMNPQFSLYVTDKAFFTSLCQLSNFKDHIPLTINIDNLADAEQIYQQQFVSRGFHEVILKPRFGASGFNICIIKSTAELHDFLSNQKYFDVYNEVIENSISNGFIMQRCIIPTNAPLKITSPSVNMELLENTILHAGKTEQILDKHHHLGNKDHHYLFRKCKGMKMFCNNLAKLLWALHIRGTVGFDFIMEEDSEGVVSWWLIEMNIRDTGANQGLMRHHDIQYERKRHNISNEESYWLIGSLRLPTLMSLNEVIQLFEKNQLSFNSDQFTGVLITMVNHTNHETVIHYDIYTQTKQQQQQYLEQIQALKSSF